MRVLTSIFALLITLSSFAQSWQDVGGGTNNSSHAMLTWNGYLVNLGSFNNPCARTALWDGTNWSCLPTVQMGQVARAGVVWNGNLVVVGDFWNTQQPCVGCNGVAMWDDVNQIWTPLGNGVNNDVLCVTVYNGDLIIGGDFTQASGVPSNRVVRYNETLDTWESIGNVGDMDNDVRCMTVFDGELWVGGDFNNVGGNSPSDGVVKWEESSQTWVGGNYGVDLIGGVNETVRVLYVNPNDGNLYMGGHFPELIDGDFGVTDYNMAGVAMYDGSNWYALGTGLNDYCRAIHEYNGNLIVGGKFTTADGVNCNKIAKWNGTTFYPMGLGFDGGGIDEYVKSATVWNGIFFAGGAYTQAEGGPMNYIAQWYEAPSNPPVAAMTPSLTSGCEGSCVDFMDNSSSSPDTWTWSFPGASVTSSTAQNPTNICYNTAGTYTVTLQACNSNGCDVTTTDITIGSAYNNSENITVCNGTSYIYPDGFSESISGNTSHTSNLTTAEGCDSIIVTNITAVAAYNQSENITACQNSLITYPDGSSETITGNTSHTSTLMSTAGCDSIIVTNVTMNPNFNAIESATVCANTVYTYPDGFSETITGNTSHTSNLTTVAGCDSVIVTNITMSPSYNTSESINVCNGITYTYPDGFSETISANTSHTSMLTSIGGCDSVIVTNVSVAPSYNQTENIDICSGSTYSYPDGTVSTNITVNESHTSSLSSVNGCDSIIVTNLSVNTSLNYTVNEDICSGTNYTYPDGTISNNIINNESQVSTLTSQNGCDSIITTYLNVLPTPSLNPISDQSICVGESITLTATPSQTGGTYDWSPGGLNTQSITVSPTTSTTYVVTYTLNGCASQAESAMVTVNPMPDVGTSLVVDVITVNETGAVYQWLDCNNNNNPLNGETNQSYTATTNGSYAAQVDLNGCIDTSACVAITGLGLYDLVSSSLSIHPNPANNEIHVTSDAILEGLTYKVIDLTGRIVKKGIFSKNAIVNIDPLTSGSYFLELELDASVRIQFVKR